MSELPLTPPVPEPVAPVGSRFADVAAARRAVALALPMLEAALRDRAVGESGCLHIVIMDPARYPGDCGFEDAILHEHSLPDRAAWDADYAAYARDKARLSWRTGRATASLQRSHPHLLRAADTLLGGGAVSDGIVVAVSGANPWFDEAFALCVAALLKAEAHDRRQRIGR